MPTQEEYDKLVAEHAALGKRFDAYIADQGQQKSTIIAKFQGNHAAAMDAGRKSTLAEAKAATAATTKLREQRHASTIGQLAANLADANAKIGNLELDLKVVTGERDALAKTNADLLERFCDKIADARKTKEIADALAAKEKADATLARHGVFVMQATIADLRV